MYSLVVDVNVLLEEALWGEPDPARDESTKLLTLMIADNINICVTPTMLKDLRYLIEARSKRFLREKYGEVKPADALFVKQFALSKLDWYLDNATIISEGLVDCRMARQLMKVHNDYEDNLIAAAAIRTDATGIVTRDEKFARSCQVKCFTPGAAIKSIQAGLWG